MDCIFCKIVQGTIPAHKVYEDDAVLAFLDIHPINPGHILVIPKKHESHFEKLDDENYGKVMLAAKKLSEKVSERLQPKRVGLAIMGWDVPHVHVHVIPMNHAHDLTSKKMLSDELVKMNEEDFKNIQEQLIT